MLRVECARTQQVYPSTPSHGKMLDALQSNRNQKGETWNPWRRGSKAKEGVRGPQQRSVESRLGKARVGGGGPLGNSSQNFSYPIGWSEIEILVKKKKSVETQSKQRTIWRWCPCPWRQRQGHECCLLLLNFSDEPILKWRAQLFQNVVWMLTPRRT